MTSQDQDTVIANTIIVQNAVQSVDHTYTKLQIKKMIIIDGLMILTFIMFITCLLLYPFYIHLNQNKTLIMSIVLAGLALFATCDILLIFYLWYTKNPKNNYTLTYIFVKENRKKIGTSLAVGTLVVPFNIKYILQKLTVFFDNSTELNAVNDLKYILSTIYQIILILAMVSTIFLIGNFIICALKYHAYMSNYARRIKMNIEDLEVVNSLCSAITRNSTRYLGIITNAFNISSNSDFDLSNAPSMIIQKISGNNSFFTKTEAVAYFGEITADKIFKKIDIGENGILNANELELFINSTHNELNQLTAGLKKKDVIISKISYAMLVIEIVLSILGLLVILKHTDTAERFWVCISTMMFAISYIFSKIIYDFWKSLSFILLSRPYDIGDIVMINEKILKVTDIGFMRTKFDDGLVECSINNNKLISHDILNIRNSIAKEEIIKIKFNSVEYEKCRQILLDKLSHVTDAQPEIYLNRCSIECYAIESNSQVGVRIKVRFKSNFTEISDFYDRINNFILELNNILISIDLKSK